MIRDETAARGLGLTEGFFSRELRLFKWRGDVENVGKRDWDWHSKCGRSQGDKGLRWLTLGSKLNRQECAMALKCSHACVLSHSVMSNSLRSHNTAISYSRFSSEVETNRSSIPSRLAGLKECIWYHQILSCSYMRMC